MNHLITNKTMSVLDMSPLKDVFGKGLTLRPNESREISDATLHDEIAQRVIKAKWLTVDAPAVAEPAPAAAVPPLSTTPSTPAAAVPPLPEPEPEPEPLHPAPVMHEPEPAHALEHVNNTDDEHETHHE